MWLALSIWLGLLVSSLGSLSLAESPGRVSACRDHMETALRPAVLEYVVDHGALPADLEELVPEYVADTEPLRCPFHPEWVYCVDVLEDGRSAIRCHAHIQRVSRWMPAFGIAVHDYDRVLPTMRPDGEVFVGFEPIGRVTRPAWEGTNPPQGTGEEMRGDPPCGVRGE